MCEAKEHNQFLTLILVATILICKFLKMVLRGKRSQTYPHILITKQGRIWSPCLLLSMSESQRPTANKLTLLQKSTTAVQ